MAKELSFNQRMAKRFSHITTSRDKALAYIHETAMMILEHAKAHGDCSTAQGLVMSLPERGPQRADMVRWFRTFSPIATKNSDKFNSCLRDEGDKLFNDWDVETAKANPFHTLGKEDKEPAEFDLGAMRKAVESLAKRIDKAIEDGRVPEDDMATALAFADKVKAFKVDPVIANNLKAVA